MSYSAPLKDMLFNIEHLARIDQVAALPGFEDAGLETAQAVLEECAKLNEGVIAPLNFEGDKNPSFFKDGQVTTTPGFKDAFRQYAEGGWQGLQHPVDFSGQGLCRQPARLLDCCIITGARRPAPGQPMWPWPSQWPVSWSTTMCR